MAHTYQTQKRIIRYSSLLRHICISHVPTNNVFNKFYLFSNGLQQHLPGNIIVRCLKIGCFIKSLAD